MTSTQHVTTAHPLMDVTPIAVGAVRAVPVPSPNFQSVIAIGLPVDTAVAMTSVAKSTVTLAAFDRMSVGAALPRFETTPTPEETSESGLDDASGYGQEEALTDNECTMVTAVLMDATPICDTNNVPVEEVGEVARDLIPSAMQNKSNKKTKV